MLRRLTAFAMLLCVIGAGIYLTMTMLFKISSIQVQTADGKQVQEVGGYSADRSCRRMGVQLERTSSALTPATRPLCWKRSSRCWRSIRVVRDYPNTVVVQVTEAVPAYAMQNGSSGWLTLSDKLKILEKHSAQPEGLAPCTAASRCQDTRRPADLCGGAQGRQHLRTAPPTAVRHGEDETDRAGSAEHPAGSKLDDAGMSADVTRIEFADTDEMAFLYQDRISVWLGTLNDLDYKLDRHSTC